MSKWLEVIVLAICLKVSFFVTWIYLLYVTDEWNNFGPNAGFAPVLFLIINGLVAACVWPFLPDE